MLQVDSVAKLPLFTAPQTKAPGDFAWFVYGSSLDFDAFGAWCKEHGYVLPELSRASPATLPGWRLAFNVRSSFWGGTVSSLVEDAAGAVHGLLLPLPAEALGFVRHKEGVLSGLFEEKQGVAKTPAGTDSACLFYVAVPARTVPEERPAARFLETLIKGARERGLPADWISSLEARR